MKSSISYLLILTISCLVVRDIECCNSAECVICTVQLIMCKGLVKLEVDDIRPEIIFTDSVMYTQLQHVDFYCGHGAKYVNFVPENVLIFCTEENGGWL